MGQGLAEESNSNHITPAIGIRLVPGLSIAALKLKQDKELALWYCLRRLNHWGSGRLVLHTSIRDLTRDFNYSKSALYRILEAGNGIFWQKRTHNEIVIIVLSSLQKMALHFNTQCGRGFIEIPVEDFVGNGRNRIATQRSWCYATFHKPIGSKATPISRLSIQDATGVKRRTQQRYDKVGVKRFHNYANQSDGNGRIIPRLEYVDGKTNRWLIQKQLGNSYLSWAKFSARGIIRRVNSAMNRSSFRREAWFKRRFFISARSYIKCSNKDPDPYVCLKPKGSTLNGGMQWCTP
jgi:hypothetical protein